jgi:hypothetical protein
MKRSLNCRSLCLAAALAGFWLLQGEAALAQTLKQQLVGTWKVVSATMQVGDETKATPLGKDIVGFIMYSPDGYMCFTAMSGGRQKFGSADRVGGTVEQRAAAFDTYRSTCGRYEVVDEQNRVITHAFDVSLIPDVTGQSEKRFVQEISADILKLKTVPHVVGGKQAFGLWTYQRVK